MHPSRWDVARGVAATVIAVAACILVTSILGSSLLPTLGLNGVSMAPATALAFCLSGSALWALAGARAHRTAQVCALAALLIGVSRLLAYAFGWGRGIDSLWIPVPPDAAGHFATVAPATALNFVLIPVALLLASWRRGAFAFQVLLALAILIGLLGLARYAYGGEPLGAFAAMSFPTAILFIALATAALFARTDTALMRLLHSAGPGGMMARRFLPLAIVLPLILAWFPAYAERSQRLTPEAALALFALCTVAAFGIMVSIHAAFLERTDQQRKQVQQELRAVEERTRLIVESSDDAIISKTLEGTITSWNPAAETLFGYTAAQAIGQSMQTLIPQERLEEEPVILAKIGRGELVDHFETVRLRADGTRIEISATISPLRDGDGRIIGASKIARDISERKVDERRLQAQLARLNLLQQITRAIGERQDMRSIFKVAISSVEEHLPIDFGCIALYEPATKELQVACVGAKSWKLAQQLEIPEDARISVDQNGLGRCVQGQLVYESETSGSPFPFPALLTRGGLHALVIAPLSVDNKVSGVMIAARRESRSFASADCEFLRQLSEHLALAAHQAQLHASLQQAYQDLRQTQQAVLQQERLRVLGQMASGMAHDINNALSPAMLYAQSLLEREAAPLDVEAREHLTIILRAIDDVAATVARMKDFYRRSESGQSHAVLDLNEIIQQVIELTRVKWVSMAQESGLVVTLNKELAQNLPKVRGAEAEVRDAIANLIINAVDAMPEGGTLTLRSRAPDASRVCVEVVDTGLGMDEDTRQRCLEPFFTTKGERGTGLGLAMVYGMLERHEGEVQIESEPGKGTLVRMVFPAVTEKRVDERGVVPAPRPTTPLRILLVDDDPIVLKSLRAIIAQDGHTVVDADGGSRGIDLFLAAEALGERFSVVITDLGMPHVDGRKVAAAVKAAAPTVPVILMTGWGQGLQSGSIACVDRVLSKPPKMPELRRALAELVNHQS
jgi:PAS domain S-box-containing protein